jgi:hypothetical protein
MRRFDDVDMKLIRNQDLEKFGPAATGGFLAWAGKMQGVLPRYLIGKYEQLWQ